MKKAPWGASPETPDSDELRRTASAPEEGSAWRSGRYCQVAMTAI